MKLLMLLAVSACLALTTSATPTPGLKYRYYEGDWNTLPDFNTLTPVKEGIVSNMNLDVRKREKQYAIVWRGYISITTAATYTFETLSDDGSELYIGSSGSPMLKLVNNDGIHGPQLRTGSIYLKTGMYPIVVTYFQKEFGQTFEVYWSGNPGTSLQKIPSANLIAELEGARFTNTTSGLYYSYHEGTWSTLPDFNSMQPISKGIDYSPNLDIRKRETKYAIRWLGYINIPDSGAYTFTTMSDDGSRMLIGDHAFTLKPVVLNDGLHASQSRSGTVTLKAGIYPIEISFFQNDGGQIFKVYWSSNTGIANTEIPDKAFIADLEGVSLAENEVSGLKYSYYEGSWSSLPDFRRIAPVKDGMTNNATLAPRNRELNYAFLWTGFIQIPTAGSYTFQTTSDDGSKLYIGNYLLDSLKPLVSNDGLHGPETKTGTVYLSAGVYPFSASFFQNGGGQTMAMSWSSNTGVSIQQIPDAVFLTSTGLVPRAVPAELLITPGPSDTVVTMPVENGGLRGRNNYYFSSSMGDDSRTSTQAKDSATPWKTLSKLNAYFASLEPGDAVLLKRGDVFDGSITVTKSGTANQPIMVSAYGSGPRPVINGLAKLNNWTYVANGVWEADFQTTKYVNMVVLNGIVQAMGRYPNYSDINRGYLKLESHSGNSSITDNELTGTPNWNGGEVVIRKVDWVLDRGPITGHSGNTISYVSPTAHQPVDGHGYFIQNHPSTLDKRGEWYYDAARKKMKMYFEPGENPNDNDVKASNQEILVTLYIQSYLTFDNLDFEGANERAFYITYGTKNRIQNCMIDKTGSDAIFVESSPYIVVENNTINHSNNSGIRLNEHTSHSHVKNNIIKNSGLLPGMGKSNNQQMDGIFVNSTPSSIIEFNRVDSSGYCGITFTGDSTIVRNNFVNYFCLTVNDGGGIYTWGGWDKVARKITGNIVLHGIGAPAGTSSDIAGGAVGIYTDDRSSSIEVNNNTVAHCSRAGILFHNSNNMAMQFNTLFDNMSQLVMIHDDGEINDPIRKINSNLNNILFSKTQVQSVVLCGSRSDDFQYFGRFDDNYYVRPLDENGIISLNYPSPGGQALYAHYDLAGWQKRYGYDLNTKTSPIELPEFTIKKLIGANKFTNGKFDSNITGAFCISSPGRCTSSWISDGKIDGGAMRVSFDAPGTQLNDVGTYVNIGAVQAGKTYVIKFSLLGEKTGKTLKGFMLDGANYGRMSTTRYFECTNTRVDHDFQFTPTFASPNAILAFEVFGQDLPFVIDNFEAYEAEVVTTNPDDYIRFEYNATGSTKTVTLSEAYVDVTNKLYSNNVTLAPFSSIILIKKSSPVSQARIMHQEASVDIIKAAERIVKVSPNPAGNTIQISLSTSDMDQHATLSLYSFPGVKIKTIPVIITKKPLTLDVSSLTSGVYYIQLNINGKIINEKFVKL